MGPSSAVHRVEATVQIAVDGAGIVCGGKFRFSFDAEQVTLVEMTRKMGCVAVNPETPEGGASSFLVSWAEDVKTWALQQALSGVRYPGFKLVEGRSIRKYTDEAAVAAVVTKAGFDPYEQKLLGITAMQKQLGTKRFDELLSGLVIKPAGKPVLAPASDKRPEYKSAADDFMEE